jgi:flavoprotein
MLVIKYWKHEVMKKIKEKYQDQIKKKFMFQKRGDQVDKYYGTSNELVMNFKNIIT